MLQQPDVGGEFEFAPMLRGPNGEENYEKAWGFGFMQGPEIPGQWVLYNPAVYPEKMVNPGKLAWS